MWYLVPRKATSSQHPFLTSVLVDKAVKQPELLGVSTCSPLTLHLTLQNKLDRAFPPLPAVYINSLFWQGYIIPSQDLLISANKCSHAGYGHVSQLWGERIDFSARFVIGVVRVFSKAWLKAQFGSFEVAICKWLCTASTALSSLRGKENHSIKNF